MLSHVLGAVDKTSSSFSAHGKIGNFIIIIIKKLYFDGAPAANAFVGHSEPKNAPGGNETVLPVHAWPKFYINIVLYHNRTRNVI